MFKLKQDTGKNSPHPSPRPYSKIFINPPNKNAIMNNSFWQAKFLSFTTLRTVEILINHIKYHTSTNHITLDYRK